MPKTLSLAEIKEHNRKLEATSSYTHEPKDVLEGIKEHFAYTRKGEDEIPSFVETVFELRNPRRKDAFGNLKPIKDISFEEACQEYFGCSKKQLLASFGIYGNDTLDSAALKLGVKTLSKEVMHSLVLSHSQKDFSAFVGSSSNTLDRNTFSPVARFLLPEIFMDMIRLGYEGGLWNRWTAFTQTVDRGTITMPYQLQPIFDGMEIVAEGGDIPLGTIKFGVKQIAAYKVGTGFVFTDELLRESTLDMLQMVVTQSIVGMNIKTDMQAINALVNGETARDYSGNAIAQGALVVGVGDTTKKWQYEDFVVAAAQMSGFQHTPTDVIIGYGDTRHFANLPEFKGSDYDNKLVQTNFFGNVMSLGVSFHKPPTSQILLIDNRSALAKISVGGLSVETQRNPKNQTEELYITERFAFVTPVRTAKVAIKHDVAFASQGFAGTFMDVEAMLNQSFK